MTYLRRKFIRRRGVPAVTYYSTASRALCSPDLRRLELVQCGEARRFERQDLAGRHRNFGEGPGDYSCASPSTSNIDARLSRLM